VSIYSAGDCAVCLDTGAQLLLARTDGSVFLYCPMCGTAWRSTGEARKLTTIEKIQEVAPAGFHIATEAEIRAQGWWHFVVDELRDSDWSIP
jgi:Zn-finger nucleic acid-binding protein